MTIAWSLNAIGLFATTVGALLLFLHVLAGRRFADDLPTPETKHAYAVQHRRLVIAVGLLSLWLVIQDVAVILL